MTTLSEYFVTNLNSMVDRSSPPPSTKIKNPLKMPALLGKKNFGVLDLFAGEKKGTRVCNRNSEKKVALFKKSEFVCSSVLYFCVHVIEVQESLWQYH